MKKIFLGLIIILIMQGCYYQSINSNEIRKAIEFCEEHKGVLEIRERWSGYTMFICNDGSKTFEYELIKTGE